MPVESPLAEELAVPVPGGSLAVLRWPAAVPDAPTVLAVHGITGNAQSWAVVARQLAGRATLLAPDLRGRAGSSALPGPYGLARHAADLVLAVRQLGVGPVQLTGHSMGAWVSALAAVAEPELFTRVLLVDGAVSFPLPPGVAEEDALAAVLGPALDRLTMTFTDLADYRAHWARHPVWPSLDAVGRELFLARDLTGVEPRLRTACVPEAVETDGAQVLLDPEAAAAVRRLGGRAELLWAERGLQDQPQGLYDAERLAGAGLELTTSRVADSNHYSIVMGAAGAAVVAERMLAAAGG
ncbi:alpha/beta hydrolase [Kitasatospora sp. RB6PN24]|uniref:alpha/beta hydrolase n=1 Tax=Kitasatospora humi TaxID=2893891 RepID=UPI001E319691|nr:alpha/beta hydrolase [Kitasatospora humi]MCC9308589.1 alpha/beta hydrolase [Kitasatospora humi]